MLKQKNICVRKLDRKKLTKKKLWTFEWPKMSHIFISPYHIIFGWISIFVFLTCILNYFLECLFFIWAF